MVVGPEQRYNSLFLRVMLCVSRTNSSADCGHQRRLKSYTQTIQPYIQFQWHECKTGTEVQLSEDGSKLKATDVNDNTTDVYYEFNTANSQWEITENPTMTDSADQSTTINGYNAIEAGTTTVHKEGNAVRVYSQNENAFDVSFASGVSVGFYGSTKLQIDGTDLVTADIPIHIGPTLPTTANSMVWLSNTKLKRRRLVPI